MVVYLLSIILKYTKSYIVVFSFYTYFRPELEKTLNLFHCYCDTYVREELKDSNTCLKSLKINTKINVLTMRVPRLLSLLFKFLPQQDNRPCILIFMVLSDVTISLTMTVFTFKQKKVGGTCYKHTTTLNLPWGKCP